MRPNTSDLFYSKFHDHSLHPVATPSRGDILCLASVPEACWILTQNGHIFMRTDMSPDCPEGRGWEELDLTQLHKVSLVHLALGSETVWAVDAKVRSSNQNVI